MTRLYRNYQIVYRYNLLNTNLWCLYMYCKTCFFPRASIFRDFRDFNSIREKCTIAKISMLIIFTVLGPFSCILGVFRVFAVFCRHCFSPIREKYTLAKILVGHSRTIDAPEIYPFYSIYRCKYLCIFSVIYNTFM